MAETKEYGGFTYVRQADGSWARQDQPQVFYQDPSAVRGEQRADEDQAMERERLRMAREEAARSARAETRTEAEFAQEQAEAAELQRTQAASDRNRLAQISAILDTIDRLEAQTGDGSGIGSIEGQEDFRTGDRYMGASQFFNQDANTVYGLLEQVQGDMTQQVLAQLVKDNGGTGASGMANTAAEAARMAAAIAPLNQNMDPTQFAAGLKKAREYYERLQSSLAGEDQAPNLPEMSEEYQRELTGNPPPADRTLAGQGATTTTYELPQEYQDRHAAYLRQNWGNITPDGYAQFRAGLDNEFPDVASPDLEAYRAIAPAFNQAAAEGQLPEDMGAVPGAERELSGLEQGVNNFVTDPLGTGLTSAINSATFGVPDRLAGRRLQAAQELNPKAAFAGDLLGGTVGSSLGIAGATMAGAGRFAPLVGDALYGTTFGALSDDDPVTGALIGGAGALVGDQVGKYGGRAIARMRSPDDPLSEGGRAIMETVGDQDEVIDALTRAQTLGVPMTLADASPELQSLAGSAVRFSPTTAGQARQTMAMRNEGQLDRLAEAVERALGPVSNIPQRSADLSAQAKANAGPLYDYAYDAPGAADVDIMDLMGRPTFKAAMKEAYREAADEGVDPSILGFVMDEAGEVGINPDAFGGVRRATVNAESNILQPRTIRAYGGREVVKQGPLDLVGWLRTQGGLRDSGGELSSMGLTNKARGKGAELVGRESEFGPLVNPEDGMDFDTAALYAWEAGYFPELSERPDINTFLDAMRDTADGVSQRFKVDDLPEVEAFRAARGSNNEIRNANALDGGMWEDVSQPAGMREAAPAEAYGSEQVVGLDWRGLDYIKRGLDNVIESNTSKIDGANPDARRAAIMKNTLVGRMDAINPEYAAARQAYAGPMQERAFLSRGQDAITARPDELSVELANLTPEQRQQMQLGFQSEIMGRAGNLRNNSNPWAQINTPNAEGRMGALYEGTEDADIARLLDQRDLELQLAGSANRLIGNSATAEREIADEFFKQRTGMGADVGMGIIETGALGGPWMTVGKSVADRVFKDRREQAAAAANRALADDLGPLLLSDGPQGGIDALSGMAAQDADYQAIVEALLESGDRYGRQAGTAASGALANRYGY